MKRRRWVLAMVALALPSRSSAAPDCRPSVSLIGDAALVAEVGAALAGRGVSVGAEGDCVTRAELDREPGGEIHVAIVDPDGRTSERSASSPKGAATAIALWAGVDQTAPLLPLLPTSSEPIVDAETPPVEPAHSDPERRASIGASGEVGLSGDLATWRGAKGEAYIDFDPVCAGIDLRYATDTRRWGDSRDRSTSRRAIDIGLNALWAIDLGGVRAGPGIGIGVATVRSTRRTEEELLRGDSAVPQLRAAAALILRLRGAWALHVKTTYGWMVGAPEIFGDPDPDPDDPPPMAGAPTHHLWLSVGIAYEGL